MQVTFGQTTKEIDLKANATVCSMLASNFFDKQIIAATNSNGQLIDLNEALQDNDHLNLFTFDDKLGKQVFWHSSAHILAEAVLQIYPKALPTIGPPIGEGFYYDFANLKIQEKDLKKINAVANEILKTKAKFIKTTFPNIDTALQRFTNNRFKQEIIYEVSKEKQLLAYQQGNFFDLCRGPHLPHSGLIGSFQITRMSGAYWRGDQSKEALTRIYGISFPNKKQLKLYNFQRAEAKKRDHRILANKLNLFSFHEYAPGMPIFHHAGNLIFQQLISLSRELQSQNEYLEIKTPHMLRRELWELSGHWENYQKNMYTANVLDEGVYAIKPMNCPGGMLHYKSNQYSHHQLPLRIAEFGLVHRHEASGALAGLFRVRSFHQDDAHIFLTPIQLRDEIKRIISLANQLYKTFGLNYHMELSTRPKESIGSDQDWQTTTEALEQALQHDKHDYKINLGDGAFYGPKIDFHIRDCINRTWQCGTIQLDMSLPQRFDLSYINSEGNKSRPIVIHRALLGSVERFLAIILEHYGGRLPLWLSPTQVLLLPISQKHNTFCEKLRAQFKKHIPDLRIAVDTSNETLGKKVRNAQNQQINYLLAIGDKEASNQDLNVRIRENNQTIKLPLEKFISSLKQELMKRSQVSVLAKT